MAGRLLVLMLFSSLAFAEPDGANLYQPKAPEAVGYPNYVLTLRGYGLWKEDLAKRFVENEALRVENAALRADVVTLAAKPELTWKGALVLVGVGLLVGAGVGIPVALAIRR